MSKIKFGDVKQIVENSGWLLKSTTYVNLKTDLELECPEGHNCFCSFETFRRGTYECPICKQNQYYKVDNVATKKNGYRILALDQATITSGWAIFDDDKLIKYGAYTSEGKRSTERIAKTKYWVASMIQKWSPDLIVLEDIQLQTYKKNDSEQNESILVYKKLAHLQGVLKNYLYELNLPYKVVPPATWKHYSEIKGKNRTDQKRNAQLKVKKLYDISVTQDQSDAILIGRWATHENKTNEIIEF